MTALKFTYDNEVRRILLRENEEKTLSYSKLLNHLLSLFPALAGPLTGKIISLTYEDEDGDMITCSSDVELEEALRVMREETASSNGKKAITLRFGVRLLDDTSLPTASPAPVPVASFPSCSSVHGGVTCDECSLSPIVGVRYKCAVRHDFDLCERCEAKKQQPYPMIKIVDPSQAPEILIFSLRDGQGRNEEGVHSRGHGRHHHWPRGFRGGGHPHHPPHPHAHAFPGGHPPPPPPPHHQWAANGGEMPSYPPPPGSVPPGPGHCPWREGGRGGGRGGCRWGRKLEKWANEFVKDPSSSPVVAPFVAAMDSVVNNLTSAFGGDPSPRPSHPQQQQQDNHKETETDAELEEERMLEEVLLKEAAAAASAKNTSDIEDQLLENAILESLTINNNGNNKDESSSSVPAKPEYIETSKPAVPTLPKPALRFVRDITFPDGTIVQPGAIFRKVWRVRNDGAHPWPEGSSLVNVGGDVLSLDGSLSSGEPVTSLAPDGEAELSVRLMAPEAPGMYTTYYRAQTKEKQYFGQRLWAAIVVADSSSSHNDWVNILDDDEKSPPSSFAAKSPTLAAPVIQQSTPSPLMVSSTTVVEETKNNDKSDEQAPVAPVEVAKPVVVSDNSSTQSSQQSQPAQPPAHLRSALLLWRRELSILNDMGFSDVEVILPLLQQHFTSPLSLSADKNAAPNVEGMQAIVATLLQLQTEN